ncbi:MAG: DegT/DnrJ/EryC1/StrS family aminotransferase [Fimbriimonadaceae bacterium]|nr:DegT/DnrJ/EryC1/StrS family aminotransferase [Fimbriimonadaceae bacterium]
MNVQFIDLKTQYEEVRDILDPAIAEILSTGAYVLGKWNKQLEDEIAARHGVKHAICVNSGTDALRIMMQAADIGPGDEVITTAFTFVATVETIAQLGAVPVFVDIDRETMCIDPSKIEAAITPKTKAIMPVHLFGQLVDVKAIQAIAEKHNLLVLEDSAQVIDGHHEGVYTGNWGIAAGISFYVTKNLGAAGDGGMILTNDPEIDRRSRSIRIHGMGRERYYYDELGYTSRLAEIQAAVLACKLTKLDEWNAVRLKVANYYLEAIANADLILPRTYPGNNNVWHQFTIQTTKRDELMNHLKENGIASAIFYPVPIHMHEPYAHYGNGKGSLPITEIVSEQCLSLPVHQHMTMEQAEFVAKTICAFVGEKQGSHA